jgi:hypothetical protein
MNVKDGGILIQILPHPVNLEFGRKIFTYYKHFVAQTSAYENFLHQNNFCHFMEQRLSINTRKREAPRYLDR